jgi:hypothetical protein
MFLRKATQAQRATVSQEYREILPPEKDAPPGSYRHLQILIPQSPRVVFVLTPDEHWELGSNDNVMHKLGANRSYKGTNFPSNAQITLCVGPDQTLWAAAEEGIAEVGLLIEYRGGMG